MNKEWVTFYRPVFGHEGSTLSADSAYLYNPGEEDTYFDAFGNVIITQPNGAVIYADKLHYVESTRLATLTNNVRMVDKGSVLTTNYLTYNMRSGIGTYTGGGRIVNESDTITSKNGYYFDKTQDAYFRYNVIVRTPDAQIFTDTMRYNSASKMNYFYGPTNIKSGNGNLYTENGDYSTETKNARFGKNNLYTEGSKMLQGDSLYYDGQAGSGRAVKNVFFIDTAEQIIMRGHLGIYEKDTETTIMTDNPYLVLVTKSDSSRRDTTQTFPDSIGLPVDEQEAVTDSLPPRPATARTDSVYMSADTLISKVILLKDYQLANLNLRRDGGDLDALEDEDYGEEEPAPPDSAITEAPELIPDSLTADSVRNIVAPPDSLRADNVLPDSLQYPLPSTGDPDSLKTDETRPALPDSLSRSMKDSIGAELLRDSLLRDTSMVPIAGMADSLLTKATEALSKVPAADSTASDTTRTRIILAYHEVKVFKSDLQAVADSAYYGYPDSVMRLFGSPMIWSQGSQLSADTIYMQLKNQQLDNMLMRSKAFIVSTELDSSKFNQTKGRKISGFFTDNKLELMYVDGNAEAIYYPAEEGKFTGMGRTLSSRIKMKLEDNAVTDIIPTKKVESNYYPLALIPSDMEFLEGFTWKPRDRPQSKDEIINRTKPRRVKEEPVARDSSSTDSVPDNGRKITPEPVTEDSGAALKEKVREFPYGHRTMADRVFFAGSHFRKRPVITVRRKQRIISEPLYTATPVSDRPPDHTLEKILTPV